MNARSRTFTSQRAIEVLEQIERTLQERGGATTWDLSLVTGLRDDRVGDYLRYMAVAGTAKCVERAKKYQGGTIAARWEPGRTTIEIDEDQDDAPIVIRQEWEPNHTRNTFDCFLFGVPKILEGAYA